MVSERIGPWQQKRFGSDWVGEREFSVKSLVAPTTTDRPYAFFGYGGGLDRRNSRSLPRSQLAADGIGLGEGSGPQILVKSLTLDRSVKTTTFMARNEAQSMAFDLPRQTPYYYELRRQLESAELALAASGYRRVVKVPDIVPGKIPNPASISGKRTKTMSELTAVRQVVKYEEVATDPTAVWRIVSTPNLRPSEEPRTLRNLVQPAKIEMVTTRRSDELRRINLNSTQEIQPRGAPEGNLNPPLTGFSVVAMGWEQDQLLNVSVRRIEWENPEDTDEGDFGIPSWLFEDTDEGDFGIPSWLFEDTDEGEFGIPSWLFRLSLPDAVDRAKDLAVLEMDSPTDLLKPINVGLSSDLRVGQQCLAIGNPFGFDHILTASVISGLNRDIFSKAGVTIEDGAHSRMKQGAFLYNLKAQTLPKIHHCYFIKLTLEYCKFSSLDSYESSACKFNNPKHLGKMDGNETDQQGKYNYGWLAKEEDYTPGDSVGRFLSENGNHEEKDGGGVVFSGHSDGPNEGIPDLAHWLSLRFVTLRFQVFSTFCNGDFNQRRIQNILREYTESGDADEAFSCIRELGLPFFHLEVVTRALIFGMENILSTPLILKLLKKSTTGCLISSNQMSKGFSQLAESVDDLSLDSPSAITLFDKLVLIAITEEWLDASFSKSAIPDGTIVGREDKKHSQVIRIWDPGSGSKSMNWGDPVMLNLEFVMCDTTLHRELLLTFLPVGFQIENLDWDSCEDDEMMGLHWEISDIICIGCKWTQSVGSALITLLVGSGAETGNSGPVRVQFCLTDLQWPRKQQKIWHLASRYQEIWNNIPSDDFVSENWSIEPSLFFPRQYFSETEDFEDVIYPKGDPDAVSISKRDVELLLPETFVNDTIIDFYIKYLSTRIEPTEKRRYHFFNSFFFRKLADLDKDQGRAPEGRAAFLRVRKWTRKINLFEKDFLFIPVNFNLHWSLVVICYPGEVETFEDGDTKISAKAPCILHMDSLKGSHSGLKDIIQSYLWEEWKERHPESASDNSDKFLNLRFVSLELPQQDNSFDCGLFILHYVELFLMDAPSSFNPMKIDVFSSFLSGDWFPPAEASLKRSLIRKLIHGLVTEPSQNYPRLTFSNEQLDERHQRSENAEREPTRVFLAQRCSAGEPDSVCTILGTQQPSTSICLNDSEENGVPVSGCILETEKVSMVAVQNVQELGVCLPDKDAVVCLSSQDEKNEPPLVDSDNQLDLGSCAPEDAEVFKGSGCVVKDKYIHEESLLDSSDNNQKISSQAEVVVHGIMDSECCPISDNAEVMACQEHSLEISTNEVEDERCGASQDMHSAMMLDAIKEDIGPDPERTTGEAEDCRCDLSEDTDSVMIGDINKDVAERSLERNIVEEAEDTKREDTLVDPITVEDATKDNVKETSTIVDEINDSEQYVSSELKEGNTDNGMTSGSTVSSELRGGNTFNVMAGDSTNGTDETHADGEDAYANLVTGEAVPCEDDTTCTDAEMPLVDGTCSAKNVTISEKTISDAKSPLRDSTCEEKDIVVSDDKCLQKVVQGTDAKIERHYKRRKVVPSEVDKRHTRSTSRAPPLD